MCIPTVQCLILRIRVSAAIQFELGYFFFCCLDLLRLESLWEAVFHLCSKCQDFGAFLFVCLCNAPTIS